MPESSYQPASTYQETYYLLAGDTCGTRGPVQPASSAVKSADDVEIPGRDSYLASKSVTLPLWGDRLWTLDAVYNLVPETTLGGSRPEMWE